mmetsp:Transcript_6460/g.11236  ORF Transcript_6460/g.11236 Transcript_6460/m.11236 type:complete len:120 (-) Transcript_6460:599-958(-)
MGVEVRSEAWNVQMETADDARHMEEEGKVFVGRMVGSHGIQRSCCVDFVDVVHDSKAIRKLSGFPRAVEMELSLANEPSCDSAKWVFEGTQDRIEATWDFAVALGSMAKAWNSGASVKL